MSNIDKNTYIFSVKIIETFYASEITEMEESWAPLFCIVFLWVLLALRGRQVQDTEFLLWKSATNFDIEM